jgi:DNA ligase-1
VDGARVQIHLRNGQVKIFSRTLKDVTTSIPDIVNEIKLGIQVEEALVEGEVVAYGENNKPLPFQYLMRRFRRKHKIDVMIRQIPLKLYLFDVLFLNGELLIDKSYSERWEILASICPPTLLMERIITRDINEAQAFLDRALNNGHEGIMAKDPQSSYAPGNRGSRWLKIKPVKTLDLTIIAADWGSGRRRGWLSNYHLAAKNRDTGDYSIVGKTFKGLTDEEFKEMTNILHALKTEEDSYTVHVKPHVVVEVAFNEIQKSRQYKSGYALRFARINRIRLDKDLVDIDTVTNIRKLYDDQFKYKAKIT